VLGDCVLILAGHSECATEHGATFIYSKTYGWRSSLLSSAKSLRHAVSSPDKHKKILANHAIYIKEYNLRKNRSTFLTRQLACARVPEILTPNLKQAALIGAAFWAKVATSSMFYRS
jgi:hypothetical protein